MRPWLVWAAVPRLEHMYGRRSVYLMGQRIAWKEVAEILAATCTDLGGYAQASTEEREEAAEEYLNDAVHTWWGAQ